MEIRKATNEDIEMLVDLRLDFLRYTNGTIPAEQETALTKQLTGYFTEHIQKGDFIALLGEIDGRDDDVSSPRRVIVSAAFLVTVEKPANLNFITGRTGTVLNVFTYPQYRRKGYAENILIELIREARSLGIAQLDLMATAEGKPLYEKLGFTLPKYTSMKLSII